MFQNLLLLMKFDEIELNFGENGANVVKIRKNMESFTTDIVDLKKT